MKILKTLLVSVLVAFAPAGFAADVPLPPGVARITSVEGITEYNLANGLRVLFVPELPKTRSAKIVRRALRAVVMGRDPGDLSSLENPLALDLVRSAL